MTHVADMLKRLNINVAFIESSWCKYFTDNSKLHKNLGWFNFSLYISQVIFT